MQQCSLLAGLDLQPGHTDACANRPEPLPFSCSAAIMLLSASAGPPTKQLGGASHQHTAVLELHPEVGTKLLHRVAFKSVLLPHPVAAANPELATRRRIALNLDCPRPFIARILLLHLPAQKGSGCLPRNLFGRPFVRLLFLSASVKLQPAAGALTGKWHRSHTGQGFASPNPSLSPSWTAWCSSTQPS